MSSTGSSCSASSVSSRIDAPSPTIGTLVFERLPEVTLSVLGVFVLAGLGTGFAHRVHLIRKGVFQ